MDKQVKNCPGLTAADLDLLARVEQGLLVTADISRADILVYTLLSQRRALVISHAVPASISSLYREEATGRTFTEEEQPLVFRALTSGSGGRWQRELIRNGAPIIQDVYPIPRSISPLIDADGTEHGTTRGTAGGDSATIGAFVVETNMLAYERQRRRNRYFRRAVPGVHEMCLHGEMKAADTLGRFGIYDGIYLVDYERRIRYVSGNATNLFRSAGIVQDPHGEHISMLEAADTELVEQTFQSEQCQEERSEANDGRIWIRRAVPLRLPPSRWMQLWLGVPWFSLAKRKQAGIDAVIVMVHNATETVQKQRELNVKSAIIQEVHHRVKNNLQNIAAILRIQARRTENEEAKQHLSDAVNRVLSMSVIHEFLSQDEHRPISLRDVCQRIATQVAQVSSSPEQEIVIRVDGPNIRLPAGQATPVAMTINELLLNAVEHGLRDRGKGLIEIELRDLGDAVELVVTDDGNGLPNDFGTKPSRSLGLQIVQTLVTDDLKGEVSLESLTVPAAVVAEGTPDTATIAIPRKEGTVGDTEGIAADQTAHNGENKKAAMPPGQIQGARATIRFPKRSMGID